MRAAIIALGAIFLFLSPSFSAGAHEDALRAKVLFLDLRGAVISPDGSSVVGFDVDLGGAAVWRRGKIKPLERDPANRAFAFPAASSRRARVVVGGGRGTEVHVWSRGHRRVLTPDGQASDVSGNGRVIVGLVRDPVAGEVGTRWHKGVAHPITAQPGFVALSGRAVSASGRTIFGIGSFDGGLPTRFLWRRGRAIEVEGISDAVRLVSDLPFLAAGEMQLSADGSTAAHADVVSEVLTCFDFDLGHLGPLLGVCLLDIDFEAWRWRNGEIELLDEMRQSGSIPSGITANGEVIVGRASSTGGAFIWDPTHGMRSLSALLESLGADLQGVPLSEATGISDDGRRIVGQILQVVSQREILILTYLAILPPACSDRVDNDGDGRVDFPEDRGCHSRTDGDEGGERRHRRGPR